MPHDTRTLHKNYDVPIFQGEIKWPTEIDFGYYHGMFGFADRNGKLRHKWPKTPFLKEILRNIKAF